MWIHTSDKALRRPFPIILRKSVLSCHHTPLYLSSYSVSLFCSGFYFTNIHDSQDSRGKGEAVSLWLALSVWLVLWYKFSTAKRLFTGRLRNVLVFAILTIAPLISESLLGNTRVTMAILQKCLSTFS